MQKVNYVVPLLAYRDIRAAHDFLVSVFGFKSVELETLEDGTVVHGEVLAGTLRIWLHTADDDGGLTSPSALAAASSGTVVLVEDVDAHYRHVLEAGADIENAPEDKPYGFREYGVRDPEGHRWWFSTPLAQT